MLGLTQAAMAERCAVLLRTLRNYELGRSSPSTEYLQALAGLGQDVRYIVTGERDYAPPPLLEPGEPELLEVWRAAPRADREAALRVLRGDRPKSGPRIKVGGNVAQFNAGDHTTNVLTTDGDKPRYGALHEPRKPKR